MSELYKRVHEYLGDEQQLLQRMAGRMDLWEECVYMFPKGEVIEEADAALHTGREKDLYAIIHRLKGNLMNFGFDSAGEKAMAVLEALKGNDWAQAEERYEAFRHLYLKIVERIGDAE